jgi:hypothetical protein
VQKYFLKTAERTGAIRTAYSRKNAGKTKYKAKKQEGNKKGRVAKRKCFAARFFTGSEAGDMS